MKRLVLSIALPAMCGPAFAHGSIQGIDHFSGGLLHPLVEPTHLIALVALGLLIGQRGIAKGEAALFCFVAGTIVGITAAALGWTIDTDLPLLTIATLCGLLVAISPTLPGIVYGALAAFVGAGIGMASNPDAVTGTAGVASLAGAGIGANLWLLCIAALVHSLKRAWLVILVRVVGSWACASSVLVLALWVSGRHATAQSVEAAPGAVAAQMDTTR